uniref:Uncharacterized protein n=1 Tax=Oryza meridionalis TaxID=40149 RepID=A0A0E0C8E6_9ORYZ
MSTTIGASPSSHIAQNDTSLHGVNTCQRSRVGRSRADADRDAARYSGSTSIVHVLKSFLLLNTNLLYMVMKYPLDVDAKFNSAYYFRITK